jgi:Protein of unknown function (DUF3151)
MEHKDLLAGPGLTAGPAPTYLPADPDADEALRTGQDLAEVAARFPASSAAWAALAERAFGNGEVVAAYAYARTGYHRGLDQLRRAGWRGNGPVPWEHRPNQGFLRSLHMLAASAGAIGENAEAARCRKFLAESSPEAAGELEGQVRGGALFTASTARGLGPWRSEAPAAQRTGLRPGERRCYGDHPSAARSAIRGSSPRASTR